MLQVVRSSPHSIGSSVNSFLLAKRVEGYSRKTLEWYHFILADLVKQFGKDASLSELDTHSIRNHLATLEDRGLSKESLWNHLRGLRTFLRWCVAEKVMPQDPTSAIQKIRIPKRFPKIVSNSDIEKLLKICDTGQYEGTRNHSMILLMLDTGIRLSELISLIPGEINLLNRSVLINRGKGDKSRIVFIEKRTLASLRKWLETRHRYIDEPIFCSRHGEPLKPRHVLTIFQRLAKKAGITAKISPHRLRHTAATMMAKAGMNAFELAQLLGHSDVKTTMVYTHLGGMALSEAHARASPADKLFQ